METGTGALVEFHYLRQVLEEYAMVVVERYKDNLTKNGHVASGGLLNSVKYIIDQKDQSIEVSLNLKDYWYTVEYNMPTHWPPIDAILDWVKVKKLVGRAKTYDGKLPTEKQLAFLIARSIAGESPNQAKLKNPNGGTTGTHDLQKAIDATNAEFEVRIGEAITKDVANIATGILASLVG